MRLAYLAALVPLAVAACAQSSQQATIAGLESGLTAAERTALAYTSLPRCPAVAPVCSDAATVATIKDADNRAFGAVKAAEVMASEGQSVDATAAASAVAALVETIPAMPAKGV